MSTESSGTYHATPPTLVDGENKELQLDVNGNLKVAGATTITSGSVEVTSNVVPIGGAYTNRSITSLSGASETLMAANASRRILLIHNEGATSVTVNLVGGTAVAGVGGNITLTAGQQLKLDVYPPTSAITVIGTATGDITAFEG